MFKLAPDIIDKRPRLIKIFSWKNLKIQSNNRVKALMTMLILSSLITDSLIEEVICKQSAVGPDDTYYVKMIFLLLTKVIVVYI